MNRAWDEILQDLAEQEIRKKIRRRFFELLGDRFILWYIGRYAGDEEYKQALKEVLDEEDRGVKERSRKDAKDIRKKSR